MAEPTKFQFSGEWTTEVYDAVAGALRPWEWLVPDWCATVYVAWVIGSEQAKALDNASTGVSYAYRRASVDFHPAFLGEPEEMRERTVVHEQVHVFVAPLADYAECVIDELLENEAPALHRRIKKELGERLEGVVEDLTRVLCRRAHAERSE